MKTTIVIDTKLIKFTENEDTVYYLHVIDKKGEDNSYRIKQDFLFEWLQKIEI